MFKITDRPLEQIDLREGLSSDHAGALSSFEGRVRKQNEGKIVSFLEYEAHEALCQTEAENIFRETYEQFDIISANCFHRVGRLNIGDMAIWVGVIAEHRDESFKACRYIIDQAKRRLPIWKKEHYENGDSGWLACEPFAAKSASRLSIEEYS
jgi:molybdopterin synthase catalytic subunit